MRNNYITAYKFRSSAQMAFVFDIIINRRLFCSEYDKLNDPLEGITAYSNYGSIKKKDAQNRMSKIEQLKKQFKICSLSETIDSHLLWAHYAGGFDGVAIELELPGNNPLICRVDYRGIFDNVNVGSKFDDLKLAKKSLLSKYKEWEYEKEIRILNENEWYKLNGCVNSVIVGPRVNEALIKVLHIICLAQRIKLSKIVITDKGLMVFDILTKENPTVV